MKYTHMYSENWKFPNTFDKTLYALIFCSSILYTGTLIEKQHQSKDYSLDVYILSSNMIFSVNFKFLV
jgi:hypothetical protein